MNILMLTSVYPYEEDKNTNATKVVQYFTHEWVLQGHNVLVIHNMHRYPNIVHQIPGKLKGLLATHLGFDIPDLADIQEFRFQDQGVVAWRLPIKKYIPHGEHPKKILQAQVKKIQKVLNQEDFHPDIIMGHWMSPQAQLIQDLKQIYGCRTSLVLHGRGYINNKRFDCSKYLPYIDRLGCRSQADAIFVQQALCMDHLPFVCYSGVPEYFVKKYNFDEEKFRVIPQKWRFIYVGRLVRYKQIDKVLTALSRIKDTEFVFDIIGSGSEEIPLKRLSHQLGIAEKVVFHGRMPREQVLEYMKAAHCFVMISQGEVFGLVYLEAMATSCITIGSTGEGIDGVIRNNENGYLCPAGDTDALVRTIEHILDSPPQQLTALALNGYRTACQFTDSNVARWYLEEVSR